MTQVTYIHKVKEATNSGPVGYAEIQSKLGLNRNQVDNAIRKLIDQGLVKRLPSINRRRQYIGVAQ